MRILKAKLKDAKIILKLYTQSKNLNGYDSLDYLLEDIMDYIKEGSVFVAEENDKIAGAMYLEIHTTYIYLHTVIVDQKYKRKGIGSAMLRYTEAIAKKKKIDLIEMMVEENNNAMKKCVKKNRYIPGKKFVFYAKKV
ncbi:MAG: GNAT family N-acetyltransferase [Candidatus Woesearchaeota archaeon]